MRGQISIEMILLLAAILAIAFLLVTQLKSTSQQATQKMSQKSDQILDLVDNMNPACDPNNNGDDYCVGLGYDHCDPVNMTCVN